MRARAPPRARRRSRSPGCPPEADAPRRAATGRWLESLSPGIACRASCGRSDACLLPHGIDRSQVRRHVDGLAGADPERRAPGRQMGEGRAPARRRAVGDERRDEPPARARTPALARDDDRPRPARARHDRVDRRAGVGRPALARAPGRGRRRRQLRGLAGADRDRRRLHQGAHREDRRRARARRPRRRQGRRHHRLPGRRPARPHHDARPRRLRHVGGGDRRGAAAPTSA